MVLVHVTPSGIDNLAPVVEVPRSKPGDHLASYPDAPGRGEGEAGVAAADAESLMVLSEPIAAEALEPGTPYVVCDLSGRVLCVNSAGSGGWDWAYFGPYDQYVEDVMPLTFTANPATSTSPIVAKNGAFSWPLHANGSATSWEWTFFADANYGSSYPVMSFSAQVGQTNPDGTSYYRLVWNNGGTSMNLCVDSGLWNWAYVHSSTQSQFTFHKFYVRRSKLTQLFLSTWPSANFVYSSFKTGDSFFEAITDAQASAIYANSGLSGYVWQPDYFDCEDFSYVYKAQASKDAYAAKPEYAYDVGVIFGSTKNGSHAVNLFVDTSGNVRILEPQNGSICAGKDWKDSSGAPYTPTFVLM